MIKTEITEMFGVKYPIICGSILKNASKPRWRPCCSSAQNAHILSVCSAFSPPCAVPSDLIRYFSDRF
jgi:hypothetical protein